MTSPSNLDFQIEKKKNPALAPIILLTLELFQGSSKVMMKLILESYTLVTLYEEFIIFKVVLVMNKLTVIVFFYYYSEILETE